MQVQVRYFAAAKAAMGRAEETLDLPEGLTVGELIDRVEPHEATGRRVLARCSFLRNGEAGADAGTVLADGDRLDLLPPFAGG